MAGAAASRGRTGSEGSESAEVPALFVAVTTTVWSLVLLSPGITHDCSWAVVVQVPDPEPLTTLAVAV